MLHSIFHTVDMANDYSVAEEPMEEDSMGEEVLDDSLVETESLDGDVVDNLGGQTKRPLLVTYSSHTYFRNTLSNASSSFFFDRKNSIAETAVSCLRPTRLYADTSAEFTTKHRIRFLPAALQ